MSSLSIEEIKAQLTEFAREHSCILVERAVRNGDEAFVGVQYVAGDGDPVWLVTQSAGFGLEDDAIPPNYDQALRRLHSFITNVIKWERERGNVPA